MTQPIAPVSRPIPTVPNAAEPPSARRPTVSFPAEPPSARRPPVSFPAEPPSARRPSFCREADSVAEGFLCNEPTVVSNACRKPRNAFDAYVCDEPRMHALQTRVWRATVWVLKAILAEILGRQVR